MNELKRAMAGLLVDEPHAGVDVTGALNAGRSAQLVRRAGWSLAVLAVATAIVLVAPTARSSLGLDSVVPVAPVPSEIVFQTSRGMAMVGIDGSAPHSFLDQDVPIGHADWSPNGRQIVFVRDDAEQTADIWVVDRDGGNQRRLVDCISPCTFAEDPAWSPDGTRIAYWSNGGSDETQVIRVFDVHAGIVELTVPFPQLQAPVNPRWSPDGRLLAVSIGRYVRVGNVVRQDGAALGVIDLGGPEPTIRRITPFSTRAIYPAWSPSGDRIVFVGGNLDPAAPRTSGQSNLLSIRPDGTGLTQLTDLGESGVQVAEPDWGSADGPLLLVLVTAEGTSLATLEADGTGLSPLLDPSTGQPIDGRHPRRAPSSG